MTRLCVFIIALAWSAALAPGADAPAPTPLPLADLNRSTPVDFEKEILPILSSNCLACHNRTKAKADLVLETPTDILKGGESGPAVVPKKGDESLLFKAAAHRQDPVMPPKGNKVAAADLTAEQLGLLKLWIDQGATGTIGGGASVPTLQWQVLPSGLNAIYAAAVTPDGQYAACSRGNEVHVYHLPTSRLVARLEGHRDLVQSLAFSPDGSLLASGAYREVKLWRRPRDATKFTVTSAGRGSINVVDAAPDGSVFATGGADGVVRLWGAKDGRPVKELTGHGGPVSAVKFSPDGTKLASAGEDKSVRVWTVADGTVFSNTPVTDAVSSVAWVGGGRQLATAGGDAVVRVWDVPETAGAVMTGPKELKGHEGEVNAVCAGAAPTVLWSGGADGTLRRWDLAAGSVAQQVVHGAPVVSVTVRPDGKRLASAGGNFVKLWDADGKQVAEMKGEKRATEAAAVRERDLAFAASEITYHKGVTDAAGKRQAEQVERVKKAAAADVEADKAVAEKQKAKADADAKKVEADVKKADAELAKAQAGKSAAADELRIAIKSAQGAADGATDAQAALEAAEREHKQVEAELAVFKAAAAAAQKPVRTVCFSGDGVTLAAVGEDGVVHTYSADNGAAWETFRGKGVAASFCSCDGPALILQGSGDGGVVAWDSAATWALERQLGGAADSPFADRVTALSFSADGQLLATGGGVPSREGEAIVWEVAGAALVRRFERLHSDAVLALDISANGRLLTTAAADRFMKVSEIGTGRPVKSFEGHTGHVLGVSFQRTGRTLVTGAADNTVKVWDFVAGEQKKAIPGFEKEVTSVHFLGDTDQFVTTSGDGRVRLLRPDGGEVRSFPGAAGFVYAAALSRDGSVVVAGGEDGTLRAYSSNDAKVLATLPPPGPANVQQASR